MTKELPEVRFWAKVDKTEMCWLWTGWCTENGYGKFTVAGRRVFAHRWAYGAEVGPIPAGLVIDHLCRVKNCVRPSHLEVVTQRENNLRGVGVTAQNAKATVCAQGHPYDEANTIRTKEGYRLCRACRKRIDGRRSIHKAVAVTQ